MRKRKLLVAVAAGVMGAGALPSMGAIFVPLAGTTQTFDSVPAVADFSTLAIPFGANNGAAIATVADMDSAISTLSAAAISSPLNVTTGTPTTNALAAYNSDQKLITTDPTGNAGNALLVTLNNATGAAQSKFAVTYDLGLVNANVNTAEEVTPGHRVYFSTTGAAGSFTPIGNFGYLGNATTPPLSPQTQSFTFNAAVPNNGTFYLLLADDNGNANPDGINTIDNFKITPVGVPEPATLGLAAVGAVGFLARRRRQA